ncbi:MAG: hypothetical protein U5R31_15030 [Acidimicrobiia bacterium]|nr:hypothetical protein [Acidimicrobiia bacterium]
MRAAQPGRPSHRPLRGGDAPGLATSPAKTAGNRGGQARTAAGHQLHGLPAFLQATGATDPEARGRSPQSRGGHSRGSGTAEERACAALALDLDGTCGFVAVATSVAH